MKPYVSTKNTTYASLAGDATYTGTWENVTQYTSVVVAVKSDVSGTIYMEFSDNKDDSTADSSLAYSVAANINEVHKLTVTRKFYRTRYVNGSSAQSSFTIQTLVGQHGPLSAPANLTLGQDADATVTRVIDSEIDIAEGKRAGYKIINKFGRNPDIDTGTTPEDVWAVGGSYTGFPVGDDELIEVFSSSANDTSAGSGAQTVMVSGLDSDGMEQSEVVTLAGTTPVDTVNTYTRCNRLIVLSSGSSNAAFNAGTITARHTTTTANVFAAIPAGFNQSQVACYTIPAGKTGYLRKLEATIRRSNLATIDGALWVRELGAAPRLIRIFSASQTASVGESIFGGIILSALTDIAVRVTTVSANNTEVTASFDLILVNQ